MTRCLLLMLVLLAPSINGAIDAYPFPNEELEVRYNALIDKLRCPQCLNTNLAGSDAMIARDLRREVHRLLLEGKSDQEILNFMYARYGDFILYEPRVTSGTLLLWYGPAALLVVGLLVAGAIVFRQRKRGANPLSDDEAARLERLLSK